MLRATRATAVRSWRRRYPALIGYVLLAPLALWIFLVLIYPVANTLFLSLTDTRIIGAPAKQVGAANYQAIIGSGDFWQAVARSAVWLVGNVALQTVLAFATALFLREAWWLARQARIWVLLPWVIPTVAVAVIWQWMLNSNYGIVSHLLQELDVTTSPLNVFGSATGALPGLIVVNSWRWFPLAAVFIFAAMQTVPTHLYEAASIDGAGRWAQFRFITVPMLVKTLFALGLVGGLWTSNVLDIIYLITRGGPAQASTTLPVKIYEMAFTGFRIGQAAAMSVVAIGLLGAAAIVYVKLMAPRE
ncbi:MAG: sugar ABC transporter permease [Chloroflexi bacterium]|nr:sugar ABC transporter permease [Chloroflexota bacterium]